MLISCYLLPALSVWRTLAARDYQWSASQGTGGPQPECPGWDSPLPRCQDPQSCLLATWRWRQSQPSHSLCLHVTETHSWQSEARVSLGLLISCIDRVKIDHPNLYPLKVWRQKLNPKWPKVANDCSCTIWKIQTEYLFTFGNHLFRLYVCSQVNEMRIWDKTLFSMSLELNEGSHKKRTS